MPEPLRCPICNSLVSIYANQVKHIGNAYCLTCGWDGLDYPEASPSTVMSVDKQVTILKDKLYEIVDLNDLMVPGGIIKLKGITRGNAMKYKLVYDSTRQPVKLNDELDIGFQCVVVGIHKPLSENHPGKVEIEEYGTSHCVTVYPYVIGALWVEDHE